MPGTMLLLWTVHHDMICCDTSLSAPPDLPRARLLISEAARKNLEEGRTNWWGISAVSSIGTKDKNTPMTRRTKNFLQEQWRKHAKAKISTGDKYRQMESGWYSMPCSKNNNFERLNLENKQFRINKQSKLNIKISFPDN